MPGRSWLLPLRPRRASDPAAAPAASGIFRGPARLPVATRGSRALGGAAKGGCPAPNSEPTRGPGRPGTRSREWKERVRHAGHGGRAEGLRRARRGLCLAFRGPHSRLPVWLGFGSRGGEQGQGRSPGGKGTPTPHLEARGSRRSSEQRRLSPRGTRKGSPEGTSLKGQPSPHGPGGAER